MGKCDPEPWVHDLQLFSVSGRLPVWSCGSPALMVALGGGKKWCYKQATNKEGADPICLVDTNSDWINDANKAPLKLNTTNLRGQGHIRTNHFTWTCKRSCSSIFKVNHSFLVSLALQILFCTQFSTVICEI